MALNDKLNKLVQYSGRREYTRTDGNIAYLDGTRLTRPFAMPRAQRLFMYVLVAIAIVIGVVILKDTVIAPIQLNLTMEQSVKDNLARQTSLERIPKVQDYINLNDEEIKRSLDSAGYKFYDATTLSESGNMTLIIIPNDMTLDEATKMYLRGLGSLNGVEASRLFNGMFTFTVDRINTTSMVVRYADFETGDPQVAVQSALSHEDFDGSTLTDSGVDDSKNTYSMGTVEKDDEKFNWKISALPLDDMYSIAGLPEDACYVGVRVTKA